MHEYSVTYSDKVSSTYTLYVATLVYLPDMSTFHAAQMFATQTIGTKDMLQYVYTFGSAIMLKVTN